MLFRSRGGEEGSELEIMAWVMLAAVLRRGRRRRVVLAWARRAWGVEVAGVSIWRGLLVLLSPRSDDGDCAVMGLSRKVDGLHASAREDMLVSKKSTSE